MVLRQVFNDLFWKSIKDLHVLFMKAQFMMNLGNGLMDEFHPSVFFIVEFIENILVEDKDGENRKPSLQSME